MSQNVSELPQCRRLYPGPVAETRTAEVVADIEAAETLGGLEEVVSHHQQIVDHLPRDNVQRVRDELNAAYRRLRTKLVKRLPEKEARNKHIRSLADQGMSRRAIANEVGIHHTTVQYVLSKQTAEGRHSEENSQNVHPTPTSTSELTAEALPMNPTAILDGLDRLEWARADVSAESYFRKRKELEIAIPNAPINNRNDVVAMLQLVARYMPSHGHLGARLLDCAAAVDDWAGKSPE